MDFPLPLRSFTSTMDFSTPLFVDTHIVYQIDETKFPGLNERSRCLEPSLILDSDMSLKSCSEQTEACMSTNNCDEEIRDLYNLIDSLDSVVLPQDLNVELLDIPDIRLELPVDERAAENENSEELDCLSRETTYMPPSSSHFCHCTIKGSCQSNQQMSSCRLMSTPSCTKRNYLSSGLHEDLKNSMDLEERRCKKRKSGLNEFCVTNYSMENCFDNVTGDFCSETYLYDLSEQTFQFALCDKSVQMLAERQW